MINSDLTFTCKFFSAAMFLAAVIDLTGCASMEIVTEQDKMDAIELPEGVTVHLYEWTADYPSKTIPTNTGAYYDSSDKSIHTLVNNACYYEHEAKHAWQDYLYRDMTHDNFPDRLMECEG